MSTVAEGLERAALAMLHTLGAGGALLMVPQAAASSTQTGLGLNLPMVGEVEVSPVLLQTTVNGQSLLAILTQKTAQKALGTANSAETQKTLGASMLRSGRSEYRIVSVRVKRFGGVELMYELEIEA